MMRLSCSAPIITPLMPPRTPNITTDRAKPEKTGFPQGALRSHSKRPLS